MTRRSQLYSGAVCGPLYSAMGIRCLTLRVDAQRSRAGLLGGSRVFGFVRFSAGGGGHGHLRLHAVDSCLQSGGGGAELQCGFVSNAAFLNEFQ